MEKHDCRCVLWTRLAVENFKISDRNAIISGHSCSAFAEVHSPSASASRQWSHDRKVHVHLEGRVEVVCENVQRGERHHFGDLPIGKSALACGVHVGFPYGPALFDENARKLKSSGWLGISSLRPAALENFRFVQSHQLADCGMDGEAVVALVCFGGFQRNPFPDLGIQATLSKAPLNPMYASNTAGEFTITRVMLGMRPSFFCSAVSSSCALPVAFSGSMIGRRDIMI